MQRNTAYTFPATYGCKVAAILLTVESVLYIDHSFRKSIAFVRRVRWTHMQSFFGDGIRHLIGKYTCA